MKSYPSLPDMRWCLCRTPNIGEPRGEKKWEDERQKEDGGEWKNGELREKKWILNVNISRQYLDNQTSPALLWSLLISCVLKINFLKKLNKWFLLTSKFTILSIILINLNLYLQNKMQRTVVKSSFMISPNRKEPKPKCPWNRDCIKTQITHTLSIQ